MEDDDKFLRDVENRDDYIYTPANPTFQHMPFKISDTKEWIESLRTRIVEFSFVQRWGQYYEESGRQFCLQDENVFNAQKKLEWMSQFMDIDRRLLPFMIMQSREWKQGTTLEFYLQIFSVHHQNQDSIAVQCGAYILEHGPHFLERFSVQDFHFMIDALLLQMMDDTDWDIYDLLHRTSINENLVLSEGYRLSPAHREILHNFAQTHRYRPHIPADNPIPPNEIRYRRRHRESILEQNIYTDSQTVHTTGISKSIIDNMKILFDEYHEEASGLSVITVIHDIRNRLCEEQLWKPTMQKTLSRIQTDPASFQISDNIRLTTRDVLLYVYLYIIKTPEKYELFRRLAEELNEGSGTCISGHLSRIINVLVGFHPDIQMRIEEIDQVIATWQRLLQKHLSEEDDDVQERLMIDMTRSYTHNNEFITWVRKRRERFIQELHEQEFDIDIIHRGWNQLFPSFMNITKSRWRFFSGCRIL